MWLSKTGQLVEEEILRLSNIYDGVTVDLYTVMPNHVHMIILICNNGRQDAAPTLARIIGQWKRAVSIKATFSPWQKSFHDHIIRSETDFIKIAEYIENNHANWEEDCHFMRSVGAATSRPFS
jgi:REP element-mobilizing transposase RayT